MRNLFIPLGLAFLITGCGGSSNTPKSSEPVAVVPVVEPKPEETPEQKFARQQVDAVDKSCQRVVDCTLEDAKTQLTPEQLKEYNLKDPDVLAATLAKHKSNCVAAYSKPMSPRQVSGLRACLGEPTVCSAFFDCFGTALSPAAE